MSKNFETQAIRTQIKNSEEREHSVPIFLTSSFVFDNAEHARAMFAGEEEGNIYSRFSNPNSSELIDKLCLLEGTEDGMALATGMAAMFVSMASFLSSGDHILISRSVFGSTHQIVTHLFPRWNISHTYVDIDKPETWEKEISGKTKMFFAETPSNPGLDVLDMEYASILCKRHGLLLNIDNCFATPYLQKPAQWGADIITHSATKYIDGQGRVLGGAILTSKKLMESIRYFARHTGPAISPFTAWILSKSLETLAVRMERHCENAMNIAEFLSEHEEVEEVKYPFLAEHKQYELAKKQMRGGGGIVTFRPKGEMESALQIYDALRLFSKSANLGDTRSIATHPASTTHSKLTNEERLRVGIQDNTIRLSIGLEHVEDIRNDLDQALRRTKS